MVESLRLLSRRLLVLLGLLLELLDVLLLSLDRVLLVRPRRGVLHELLGELVNLRGRRGHRAPRLGSLLLRDAFHLSLHVGTLRGAVVRTRVELLELGLDRRLPLALTLHGLLAPRKLPRHAEAAEALERVVAELPLHVIAAFLAELLDGGQDVLLEELVDLVNLRLLLLERLERGVLLRLVHARARGFLEHA